MVEPISCIMVGIAIINSFGLVEEIHNHLPLDDHLKEYIIGIKVALLVGNPMASLLYLQYKDNHCCLAFNLHNCLAFNLHKES